MLIRVIYDMRCVRPLLPLKFVYQLKLPRQIGIPFRCRPFPFPLNILTILLVSLWLGLISWQASCNRFRCINNNSLPLTRSIHWPNIYTKSDLHRSRSVVNKFAVSAVNWSKLIKTSKCYAGGLHLPLLRLQSTTIFTSLRGRSTRSPRHIVRLLYLELVFNRLQRQQEISSGARTALQLIAIRDLDRNSDGNNIIH